MASLSICFLLAFIYRMKSHPVHSLFLISIGVAGHTRPGRGSSSAFQSDFDDGDSESPDGSVGQTHDAPSRTQNKPSLFDLNRQEKQSLKKFSPHKQPRYPFSPTAARNDTLAALLRPKRGLPNDASENNFEDADLWDDNRFERELDEALLRVQNKSVSPPFDLNTQFKSSLQHIAPALPGTYIVTNMASTSTCFPFVFI